MSNNKSTRIIAIGVAVFVIGGALLFLLLRNNNSTSKAKTTTAATAPTTTVAPGSVSISQSATPTTVIQFKIPDGLNAVDIPMDYFAGGGGYVRAGDQINVFAILNKDCTNDKFPAVVKLILSNVKVLEVLGTPPAPSGASASFLLALSPQNAERLIYNAKFGGLYMTLTTNNEPVASTTGVSCTNPL